LQRGKLKEGRIPKQRKSKREAENLPRRGRIALGERAEV